MTIIKKELDSIQNEASASFSTVEKLEAELKRPFCTNTVKDGDQPPQPRGKKHRNPQFSI